MSEPTEERLLKEAIQEIAINYKLKYELAVKPFMDRLIEIESMKPISTVNWSEEFLKHISK